MIPDARFGVIIRDPTQLTESYSCVHGVALRTVTQYLGSGRTRFPQLLGNKTLQEPPNLLPILPARCGEEKSAVGPPSRGLRLITVTERFSSACTSLVTAIWFQADGSAAVTHYRCLPYHIASIASSSWKGHGVIFCAVCNVIGRRRPRWMWRLIVKGHVFASEAS